MRRKISILVLALIPVAALHARADGDPCAPSDEAPDAGTVTRESTPGTGSTGAVTLRVSEVRTPLSLDTRSTEVGQLTLTGTSERGLYSLDHGFPLGTYDHGEVRVTGRRSNNYFGVYGDSTQPFSGGTGSRGYGFMIGGAF